MIEVASKTKPFWRATQLERLPIGWGQLGQKRPYVPKKRLDRDRQSEIDKQHARGSGRRMQ